MSNHRSLDPMKNGNTFPWHEIQRHDKALLEELIVSIGHVSRIYSPSISPQDVYNLKTALSLLPRLTKHAFVNLACYHKPCILVYLYVCTRVQLYAITQVYTIYLMSFQGAMVSPEPRLPDHSLCQCICLSVFSLFP